MTTVMQAVAALETLYPLHYAESWDAPGLIVGDPADTVRRIAVAVDPTISVAHQAIERKADLLVCHHPLFFRPVHEVSGLGFRGSIVCALYRAHCALWVGHTNVDAALRGVGQAAADAFGLVDQHPLEHADDPLTSTDDAAAQQIGLGRVGRLEEPITLRAFSQRVADVLPHTALGVQYAGDPDLIVRTVAVLPGAGDSLLDQVRASGVDVFVTSDLRHHPASDALQQAAHEATLAGIGAGANPSRDGDGDGAMPHPALINTPHSAIESLWAGSYALEDIPARIERLTSQRPEIFQIDENTDPWTESMR